VVFKGLIAAATAVALAAAPTAAAATNSAAVARAAAVAPATETVEGNEAMKEDGIFRGGFIIPFFVFLAIGAGVYIAFIKKNKRGRVSP
jgi:hypothetical protein